MDVLTIERDFTAWVASVLNLTVDQDTDCPRSIVVELLYRQLAK